MPDTPLAERHARELPKGTPALPEERVRDFRAQVPQWSVESGRLQRDFRFKDFREALAFVNRIGEVAERENHHPDISLHDWNQVGVALSTHSVGGLSENDFVVAARIDRLQGGRPARERPAPGRPAAA